MKHIRIVNWKSFQHYKSRRPPWIKLLTEIIDEFDKQGNPKKFYHLSDRSKLTFIGLLCLQSRYEPKIPYPNDEWLLTNTGIKKIELQPLVDVGLIAIDADSASTVLADTAKRASDVLASETETETETETENRERTMSIFDEARKLYPGTKRGLKVEWDSFRKKHKNYRKIVPLLKPAIERQIAHKKKLKAAKRFVPEWKNFKTWINQSCWEEELGEIASAAKPKCVICGQPAGANYCGAPLCSLTGACSKKYHKEA